MNSKWIKNINAKREKEIPTACSNCPKKILIITPPYYECNGTPLYIQARANCPFNSKNINKVIT